MVLGQGRIIESGLLFTLQNDPKSELNALLMQKEELEEMDRALQESDDSDFISDSDSLTNELSS